jgi:hypothetical protein
MNLFRALGIVVALYVAYAASTGEVYAKSGMWGQMVQRAESPAYFWVIIVIYAGLSVALMTVF